MFMDRKTQYCQDTSSFQFDIQTQKKPNQFLREVILWISKTQF
jgi:hypothetical protein